MLKRRSAGILMHLTALPSRYGIGDFGPQAYTFADFLKQAGANYWQMLPLTYTAPQGGFSPYNGASACALNPLLISPEMLYRQGLLDKRQLDTNASFPDQTVAFTQAAQRKSRLLNTAFERFEKRAASDTEYHAFVRQHRHWLDDFALFTVLTQTLPAKHWADWPAAIRNRNKNALDRLSDDHRRAIERERFIQYVCMQQFLALKQYCNENGVLLFGDLPIYVIHNSADVWSHPDLFKLKRDKKPKFIAGVPPDYFSKTGQLWGNPVYDWPANAATGYRWWIDRVKHNLTLFDLLRIDHFRAFEAYWQVPAAHKTAIGGTWIEGPGKDFFDALLRQIPQPPLVVEDLGVITPAVRELIDTYRFPCMKVLQFAFNGKPDNTHLPYNHIPNSIAYTGTHDNNTTLGWFKHESSATTRKQLTGYLGRPVSVKTINPEMMRLAMASPANLCIIPMQDVLGLDAAARMNNPATSTGNWRWRMPPNSLKKSTANSLKGLIAQYGRL